MNELSTARGLRLTMLLLVWVACACCVASFSEARLPKRSLSDYEAGSRLAAVTYDYTDWSSASAEDALVVTSAAPVAVPTVLKSRVEPIFRRAFSEATRQEVPGEWHVDMYYRETERHLAISYTLMFFFVASLGLVPTYAETDLYLEAKLKHDGVTVKQYVYEETVSMWLHWFVLPWSFTNDPIERKSALIDNMALNLVHDLAQDLPPAAGEPVRPQVSQRPE